MKYKIIEEYYDEKKREYSITIQNKYGRFTGKAYCNKEDVFSIYTGARYAEIRATIEYAKFRYKQEKIKLKVIQDLIKDIRRNCPEEIEKNPKLMRRINLKLRDYTQSVEDWNNLSTYLKERVSKQVEEREKILSRSNKIK